MYTQRNPFPTAEADGDGGRTTAQHDTTGGEETALLTACTERSTDYATRYATATAAALYYCSLALWAPWRGSAVAERKKSRELQKWDCGSGRGRDPVALSFKFDEN